MSSKQKKAEKNGDDHDDHDNDQLIYYRLVSSLLILIITIKIINCATHQDEENKNGEIGTGQRVAARKKCTLSRDDRAESQNQQHTWLLPIRLYLSSQEKRDVMKA